MNFCWITMKVSDLDRSKKFYHDVLGLPVGSQYESGNNSIAMLGDERKPNIELVCENNNSSIRASINVTVSVLVESLDKTMIVLQKNQVKILRGPIQINAHTKQLHILDPDGYEVLLIESM